MAQFAYGQKNPIKDNQLLITNEITGKSVKLNASVNDIKNFGTLISIDSLDQDNYESDIGLQYTFTNIIFKLTAKGYIHNFETRSNEISLEVKGMFSFSPDDHIDKIAAIFPEEVNEARIIEMADKSPYLLVNIDLLSFSKMDNKYVNNYYEGIALIFNPATKILESIVSWVRP